MKNQTIRLEGYQVGADKVTQLAAIVKLAPDERAKYLAAVASTGRKAAARFVRQQSLRDTLS